MKRVQHPTQAVDNAAAKILQSARDKLRSRLQRHDWSAILFVHVTWRSTLLKFRM